MEESLIYVDHMEFRQTSNMFQVHTHFQYELYFQLIGSRIYCFDQEKFTLHQGDVILIPPEVRHRTISSEEIYSERLLVNWDFAFLQSLGSRLAQLHLFQSKAPYLRFSLCGEQRAALRKLLFTLLEEYKNQSPTSLLHMETLLAESLLLLESVYRNSRNPATSDHHQLVSSVCEYIQNHYVENITLALLAKVFYVNEYTLSRNFNRITRLSIPQYTNLVRLSNAKEMLSSPEKCSLLQIALQSGFNSASHFDKIFRSVEHMSPREYRNLIFK